MALRRFYARPEAFAPEAESVTLSTEETRHLRDVLRLNVGDEVNVFDGEGREFRCQIAEVDRASARLRVITEVDTATESPLNLTMAVGLLKGEKFDLVVQKATELGVTALIPISTFRADVKIKSSDDAERKLTRWRRIVLEATKQCGRTRLMKIGSPVSFADLINHATNSAEERLMFAERAGVSLESVLSSSTGRPTNVIALIGSEGGFTNEEISQARDSHWKIVTLGGRIMRAETAAIAIATLLQHRFGDLT